MSSLGHFSAFGCFVAVAMAVSPDSEHVALVQVQAKLQRLADYPLQDGASSAAASGMEGPNPDPAIDAALSYATASAIPQPLGYAESAYAQAEAAVAEYKAAAGAALKAAKGSSPQPAGWGPANELPPPAQPAGWGGSAYSAMATWTPTAEMLGQPMPVDALQSTLPSPYQQSNAYAPQPMMVDPSLYADPSHPLMAAPSQLIPTINAQTMPAAVFAYPSQPLMAAPSQLSPTMNAQSTPVANVLGVPSLSSQTGADVLGVPSLSSQNMLARSVALNDDGYKSLVGKGTPEMAAFIARVGESRDFHIVNHGSLNGFAKFYSGEVGSSSFQHLVDEVDKVSKLSDGWMKLGVGASSPLNEVGYQMVVKTGEVSQMAAYVRRIVKARGYGVANEGSLTGFANYYKAQAGKVPFRRLVQEVDNIASLPDGWLKGGAPPLTGLTAALDSTGCQALQKLGRSEEMALFVRRVVESRHARVADEGSLQGFAKFYASPAGGGFPRMVQELDKIVASPGSWLKKDVTASASSGLIATLNDAGCRVLQSKFSKGSQDMAVFIRRVAESRHYQVADEGGLQGFAKYYSGEAGAWPFAHMLQEIDRIGQLPDGWLKLAGLD